MIQINGPVRTDGIVTGRDSVPGYRSLGNPFDRMGKRTGFALWHIEEMVVTVGAVLDAVGVERVGDALTGLWIDEGVFQVSICRERHGEGP